MVDIAPDTARLRTGQTQQFTAVVLNAAGAQLAGIPVTFVTSNGAILAVTTGGLATALAPGTAVVTAQAGPAANTAVVFVTTIVASRVSLSPDSFDVAVGSATAASALVLDSANTVIAGAPVTYTSSDTTVFAVSASGVVTARASGVALLRAVSGAARDSSPVVVYRTFPGTLQPRVPVASRPFGVAISSQNVLYVTRQDADSVARINLPALSVAGAAAVGADPGDVVFTGNGQTAYVGNVLGNSFTTVTVATGASTPHAAGESAWRLRLSKDQTRLYVSSPGGNVRLFDAAAGTPQGTIAATAGPANGLALSADGLRLYVSSVTGTIAELATATNAVLRTFPVGGKLQDIALSPDGAELYAANEEGSLKVVRVSTGLQVDSVALAGGPFGLALSPNGATLVVSLAAGGKIVAIDRVLRRVVRQLSVGGTPRRVAFDASGATLVVANESGGVDVIR